MFFSRKKKLLKDREAGLVFNWRESRGSSFAKIMAFVCVALGFSFVMYALKIDGVRERMLSKREATVEILNADDLNSRGLMTLVEQRSPFPPRWDPAYDLDVSFRVARGLEAMLNDDRSYDAVLQPMPEEEVSDQLVSVIESDGGMFFKGFVNRATENTAALEESSELLRLEVFISADEVLGGRLLQVSYELPVDWISRDAFGQAYQFVVGLDSDGEVISCLPAVGGSVDSVKPAESQRQLGEWLRNLDFEPNKKASMVVGLLELELRASRKTNP